MISTDDCWLWAGWVTPLGYGEVWCNPGGSRLAHRVVYESEVSEIPEGLAIDHLCRVRRCINPDHLEPVTNEVNLQRKYGIDKCKSGHDFTPENSYMYVRKPNGKTGRHCKECLLARSRAIYARNKLRKGNHDSN